MTALQLAVLAILDKADAYEWSVQGFGVARLYIRDLGRLHLWDSALEYPNVSKVHTHSWDLRSTIVSGTLQNRRYVIDTIVGLDYWRRRLVTGYQTHFVQSEELVRLLPDPVEIYEAGDTYTQRAGEIHRSDPCDGCITLMARKEDVDGQADVFWPEGGTWVTAKPRKVTAADIASTIDKARERLLLEV